MTARLAVVCLLAAGMACTATHQVTPNDAIYVVVLDESGWLVSNVGVWAGSFAGLAADGRIMLRSSRAIVVWAYKPDYAAAWKHCTYGVCVLTLYKAESAE